MQEFDVYILAQISQRVAQSPVLNRPTLRTSVCCWEVLNSWISYISYLRWSWFEFWAIMFTAFPRILCTGAPLFLVVLQTDIKILSPLQPVYGILLRRSQYSPCVCTKHQACTAACAGPSTLRQSQPSVEGDRTVRWPPQGTEQFLLLVHPRRQDQSASSDSPPSQVIPLLNPIIPLHLHVMEINTLSRVH